MHLPVRSFAWLIGCCAALGVVLFGSVAAAQTLVLNLEAGQPRRSVRDDRPDASRDAISRSDCEQNDAFTFEATVGGQYDLYNLQVWAGAGTDCTDPEAREGQPSDCWQVGEAGLPFGVPNVTVTVRVQDIVAQNPTDPNYVGTGADCDKVSEDQPITLYFMLIDGSGNVAAGSTSPNWPTRFDLSGPNAPAGLSAGVGERRLILEWSLAASSDVRGYNFYCVARDTSLVEGAGGASASTGGSGGTPASSGTTGTGTTPAAAGSVGAAGSVAAAGALATGGTTGVSGATSAAAGAGGAAPPAIDPACPNAYLFAGELPPSSSPDVIDCGGVTDPTTSASPTDPVLENGTYYAVAIAAYDDLGNIGELSNVVCARPMEVDDFFEIYRREGGKGGGGFCAVGADPTPGLALLMGTGLFGLLVRRRRRPTG